MSPAGVASTWPPLPGAVPNTTLPPDQAWPTGVTSLDSPPRTLSTHTRSSRVAMCASEPMPTWYLKSPRPCLFTRVPRLCGLHQSQAGGDLCTTAGPHPPIGLLRVVDHLADVGVEAEEP